MKMRQKLLRASTFLLASLLLATSLLVVYPQNTAYAWSEGRCINKYAPKAGGALKYWSQAEYDQLKSENCEAPEGPCLVAQTDNGYVVSACIAKPPIDNEKLSRQKCIDRYDREFNPTDARIQQMKDSGCEKPEGPCRLAIPQGIEVIDCGGHFENDFCKKYRGENKDACLIGYIGGVPACEQFSGDKREACEDGGENGLERDFDRDEANTDATCESEGGAIAWFACSVISTILDGAINTLDGWINNLLFVDGDRYQDEAIDKAWKTMRNIALLILVPMMMFMVIGTALNFGPFDPYTVKKALPRMFVATIFIVLSLPICQFGIKLSNVTGQGVGNIIINAAPSDASSITDIIANHPGTSAATGFAGIVGIAGATAAGFITLGVVGSFALVTFVALMMGFIILVMRQVLLITLMVLAPMAILVWIFPGNDKLWGIWKTSFIAMLLMYPIIAILLASGKFVAGLFG